ncbi:MAG: hypothetical protein WBO35_05225 [Candidatus Saccharimonadales bacterium]
MYYDIDACTQDASSDSSSLSLEATGATTGMWSSGLQPPYILEQFAIETLKNVAKKKGVSPSDTVTEEHVIALVAFMWGEGGDIANGSIFNPLNSGINAPELLASGHEGAGRQSFKSFDAGVEGTTRTMVGSYQSRLAATLSIKTTTAEQFMEALTYYKRYPGNHFWAALSDPDYNGSDGIPALGPHAPEIYYQGRLKLINQVRARYADMAGTVLGTPRHEATLKITAKEKLQYHPKGDTSSAGDATTTSALDSSACASTSSAQTVNASGTAKAIVDTAMQLAWPERHQPLLEAKPEYLEALRKVHPQALAKGEPFEGGADCSVFVTTVMRLSGADTKYEQAPTTGQQRYVESHPEKYEKVGTVMSDAKLQAGDILINSGHTWIFVGPQANGNVRADASHGDRMPMRGTSAGYYNDSRGPYIAYRLKGASDSAEVVKAHSTSTTAVAPQSFLSDRPIDRRKFYLVNRTKGYWL